MKIATVPRYPTRTIPLFGGTIDTTRCSGTFDRIPLSVAIERHVTNFFGQIACLTMNMEGGGAVRGKGRVHYIMHKELVQLLRNVLGAADISPPLWCEFGGKSAHVKKEMFIVNSISLAISKSKSTGKKGIKNFPFNGVRETH